MKNLGICFVAAVLSVASAWAADVLVTPNAEMKYLANESSPGIGMDWVATSFDDSSWSEGTYGVGYEAKGKNPLLKSKVPNHTVSVYTRTTFSVSDVAKVKRLSVNADYDDAYAVWINGKEVYRSPEMPKGAVTWDAEVKGLHESSNRAKPQFKKEIDITSNGVSLLKEGKNVMAVGVWNASARSSDLALVPRLTANGSTAPGATAGFAEGPGLVRGPYLQQGGPNQMIVRWRTGAAQGSVVKYGTSKDALDQQASTEGDTTEHIVKLTGLEPYTTYYYSVGSSEEALVGADAVHFFRTSPPMGKPHPTRIWVLGDSGTANENAAAVRDAYLEITGDKYTDLLLMLGDNAYNDGKDDQYQRAVFEMYPSILRQTPVWPTLGNHDGHTADSATQSGPYYEIFTLPKQAEIGGLASGTEAYYSFDYANIHFVCLESYETDRSKEGPMLTWLKNDLAATEQEWIVAFWHHPPYTKGSHDSDKEKNLIDMRENALPILEAYGVDLTMTGHSHCYERSHPTVGHYGKSSTLEDSMLSQKDTNDYTKNLNRTEALQGSIYAVAGSSGKLSGGKMDHPIMKVNYRELGSMVLEVEGKTMKAVFVNSDAEIRDTFTIEKE